MRMPHCARVEAAQIRGRRSDPPPFALLAEFELAVTKTPRLSNEQRRVGPCQSGRIPDHREDRHLLKRRSAEIGILLRGLKAGIAKARADILSLAEAFVADAINPIFGPERHARKSGCLLSFFAVFSGRSFATRTDNVIRELRQAPSLRRTSRIQLPPSAPPEFFERSNSPLLLASDLWAKARRQNRRGREISPPAFAYVARFGGLLADASLQISRAAPVLRAAPA